MKKKLSGITTVLLIVVGFACTAQSQNAPLGTWYFKSPDGQLSQRLTISDTELLYERYETYNVATPYWKEDKKLMITFEGSDGAFSGGENGKFYAGKIAVNEALNTLYLFEMREASGSKEEALHKLTEKPLKVELSKAVYTKSRLDEIENYPSLDDLKKEQLIEVMNHVFEYEEKMSALSGNDRLISQVGRNVMNRKFIELGFDPEKPTNNGYFMKRFAEDPDIKKLLDKQVLFRMY